jgi:hypothetical protein
MSWTVHPLTQHHITRDQQRCFVNLMSCLFFTAVIFHSNLYDSQLSLHTSVLMCMALQDYRGLPNSIDFRRMNECFVVVGTCVGVCTGELTGCELSQINPLHCVWREVACTYRTVREKAAGGHKKFDFVGGCSRFGPKNNSVISHNITTDLAWKRNIIDLENIRINTIYWG